MVARGPALGLLAVLLLVQACWPSGSARLDKAAGGRPQTALPDDRADALGQWRQAARFYCLGDTDGSASPFAPQGGELAACQALVRSR